jgi:radical SAM protein with 4Fe4S-binding SPASM domain
MFLSKKPLCNAPFANIYIDGDGNITPCCFNRDDILGNIYKQDIQQIWNSENAEHLRHQFLTGKFPQGCKACENAIHSGNYYNSGIFTYSRLNPRKAQILAVDFELSYWCNLSCIMCNLHTKAYELQPSQEDEILKKIKPILNKIQKARFYGGEPLLIPVYRKIWQKIIEVNPNCNILIQTNGMLLDTEFKELVKKGNFTFNISLDSLKSDTANKIRVGSDLNTILGNIKQFKMLSRHDISLAITPMRLNWKEIPDFVKFANKESLQVFFNIMVQPNKLALWTLKSDELKEIKKYLDSFTFFPFNIKSFWNSLKFKGFKNHTKLLYAEALKRTNYSNEELINISESLYNEILILLPHLNTIEKKLILNKIQSLLNFQNKEKILHYIKNTPLELLESKVKAILQK